MNNKDVSTVKKIKQFNGIVKSTSMTKTVVVAVQQTHRHPLYKKIIRRTRHFAAHNEQFTLAVGDAVVISEIKPMSKTKHFLVSEKINK